jgi:hypothetical protein
MREPPEFPYEATGLATNILRKHDEALREEILQNLILPNRALLRNGNRNRVGQEG